MYISAECFLLSEQLDWETKKFTNGQFARVITVQCCLPGLLAPLDLRLSTSRFYLRPVSVFHSWNHRHNNFFAFLKKNFNQYHVTIFNITWPRSRLRERHQTGPGLLSSLWIKTRRLILLLGLPSRSWITHTSPELWLVMGPEGTYITFQLVETLPTSSLTFESLSTSATAVLVSAG